jgi:hypothetical protein
MSQKKSSHDEAPTSPGNTKTWVPGPGTAGVSQRVSADDYEDELRKIELSILEPSATQACQHNEY